MVMRLVFALMACVAMMAQSQKYTGPRPPKPDVPYLLHADKLIELDSGTAREEQKKDDTVYIMAGTTAQAKTPMAEPIFVMTGEKLSADRLALWRLVVKGGNRELTMSKKARRDGPRPIRVTATKLSDGLYKIEAQEFCENGEYCLSPEGSNQVFCFSVY